MSKRSKKEMKAPDAFLRHSGEAFDWIEHHAKSILALSLLVVVGVVVYGAYGYYRSSAEQSAAEALYRPEAELKKAETDLREQRGNQIKDLMKKDKNSKSETTAKTPDYQTDFAPKVEQIVSVLKEHAGTKAAMVSAMNLSYFLLQQKQPAEAEKVLDVIRYRPGTKDLLGGFWQMHRGLTWMENKKYDQAVEAYQAVVDSKHLAYFHPEALLKVGFAYEMKGDEAKAKEAYEKVGRQFPRTEAANQAQQYLRLMEMKSQKS